MAGLAIARWLTDFTNFMLVRRKGAGHNRAHTLGEALLRVDIYAGNLSRRAVFFAQIQQHDHEALKEAVIRESTTPYHLQHIAGTVAT